MYSKNSTDEVIELDLGFSWDVHSLLLHVSLVWKEKLLEVWRSMCRKITHFIQTNAIFWDGSFIPGYFTKIFCKICVWVLYYLMIHCRRKGDREYIKVKHCVDGYWQVHADWESNCVLAWITPSPRDMCNNGHTILSYDKWWSLSLDQHFILGIINDIHVKLQIGILPPNLRNVVHAPWNWWGQFCTYTQPILPRI